MAMFGLPGGGEIWIILIVALVVFGPTLLAAWLVWLALVKKSSSAPVTLAAPVAPAGWFPDPTARHETRYWNGAMWTPEVSDAGVQGQDPVS